MWRRPGRCFSTKCCDSGAVVSAFTSTLAETFDQFRKRRVGKRPERRRVRAESVGGAPRQRLAEVAQQHQNCATLRGRCLKRRHHAEATLEECGGVDNDQFGSGSSLEMLEEVEGAVHPGDAVTTRGEVRAQGIGFGIGVGNEKDGGDVCHDSA